jgi:SAM-dependent methyltransferase
MGRAHWRGQDSWYKAAAFFVFGSPDTHTRLRNSYVIRQIKSLDLPENSTVLEAGCGRGIPLLWLAKNHPEWHLYGMELDPLMVSSLRQVVKSEEYENVTIVEKDILELDEAGAYDLVVCIDTLEHIVDDVGLLRRFRKSLKPGGYLVIHVPRRHQEMWRWIPAFKKHGVVGHVREKEDNGEHIRVVIEGHVREEYTASELRQVAEKAGFTVVDLRETIGRLGEISFELNNLFWTSRRLRYPLAFLTFPISVPLAYLDVRQDPQTGNSLMLTAMKV